MLKSEVPVKESKAFGCLCTWSPRPGRCLSVGTSLCVPNPDIPDLLTDAPRLAWPTQVVTGALTPDLAPCPAQPHPAGSCQLRGAAESQGTSGLDSLGPLSSSPSFHLGAVPAAQAPEESHAEALIVKPEAAGRLGRCVSELCAPWAGAQHSSSVTGP